MEVDILKYDPVIKRVLSNLKVRQQDWDDMTQECYTALLEKQKHLEKGIELGEDKRYAYVICVSRIRDIRKLDSQYRPSHKTKPEIHFDSLSDPKVYHRAMKVGSPEEEQPDATSEELEKAVLSLPFEEFRVIYELFVQNKTQEQVADDLGVNRRVVRLRMQSGIDLLKQYFEVSNGD